MKYKCECEKEFDNAQAFNGHKCHCKIHQQAKYGNLLKLNRATSLRAANRNKTVAKNNKNQELTKWISEKHVCEHCGKVMTEKFGSGRFCCRACANARKQTDDIKNKKSVTLTLKYAKGIIKPAVIEINKTRHETALQQYNKNPNHCKICGKKLDYDHRYQKCCSEKCKKISLRNAGLKSAETIVKRSKNEKYFAELCNNYFKVVYCNKQLFNGWDADIIIEDLKVAVLWNGVWHYKQVNKNHSVVQVQNRDKIKIAEIKKANYIPYVIKDLGKYNKKFVEQEFKKFIELFN